MLAEDTLTRPSSEKELSVYIHVPFCDKRCPYCDFYIVRDDPKRHLRWKEALLAEISMRLHPGLIEQDSYLRSIYFGGGTPSLLPPSMIKEVIEKVTEALGIQSSREKFSSVEITVEGNPADLLCPKKVSSYLPHVNRFSVGVQSFNDEDLSILGRNHDRQSALVALETLFACGIKNVSIDLINELPKDRGEKSFSESIKRFEKSLAQVQDLTSRSRVHHLSLYHLIIQENTLFGLKQPELPPEDIAHQMLDRALEKLDKASLKRYEISAFAKKGMHSIHNSGYWLGRRYIGLGPSAHSYTDGQTRTQNIASLNRYCSILLDESLSAKETLKRLIVMRETLSPDARQAERLSVAIRICSGVHLPSFSAVTGPLSSQLTASISFLEKQGLLERQNDLLRLTARGKKLYDSVCRELVIIEPMDERPS